MLAGSLFGIAVALTLFFFRVLPVEGSSLGIDWRGIWLGLRGGLPRYGTGLRNPPWSLIPLLPLGLLSFRSSWALLTLTTIAVEIISVPRNLSNKIDLPATLFLVLSYPSLRNIADGNLELLPIAGVLLLLLSYKRQSPWLMAGGILLASAKPQATWLLLVMFAFIVINTWSRKRILPAVFGISIVVLSTALLFGKEWIYALLTIEERGSVVDISLFSTMVRLQASPILSWGIWIALLGATVFIALSTIDVLDRFKAGLLISASLLLSPYAAGNSLLTLVAIGIVPLLQTDLKHGIVLGVLVYLGYLAVGYPSIVYSYGSYYTTVVILLAWFTFAWKSRGKAEARLAA